MKLAKNIFIFLIINFGALAIGTWLMNDGPQTNWYTNLIKAPWTPPGWVFGAAWTTIMVCFSMYMAYLFQLKNSSEILWLFVFQFIFNVSWNFVFFNKHWVAVGLVFIVILTFIVASFLLLYLKTLKTKSLLIVPYFVWLCIATSLNAYILIHN